MIGILHHTFNPLFFILGVHVAFVPNSIVYLERLVIQRGMGV